MLIKANIGAIRFSSQSQFADVNETILSYTVVEVILSSHRDVKQVSSSSVNEEKRKKLREWLTINNYRYNRYDIAIANGNVS